MRFKFGLLSLSCVIILSCSKDSPDQQAIRTVNQNYVRSWLDGSEAGVLSLFEDEAVIVPSGMAPIRGKKAITEFWFPKDSSKTIIEKFSNEIISISVDGDVAASIQKDILSWSYEKGSMKMARDQWGFTTTIYRRQADGSWKIWHQMWKDVKVTDR